MLKINCNFDGLKVKVKYIYILLYIIYMHYDTFFIP